MSSPDLIRYPEISALHAAATDFIAGHLRAQLEGRNTAELFLSGGSTPKTIYQNLSHEPLDWENVTVAQVDERWVGLADPGSNGAMIKRTLLKNSGKSANFVRMKSRHATAHRGCHAVEAAYSDLDLEHSLAVLGMGTDGHIAGWFPGSDGLAGAVNTENSHRVAVIQALKSEVTGPYLERITLTLAALASCSKLLLLTNGAAKEAVLMEALATHSEMFPISHLFNVAGDKLTIMHAG